MEEFLNEESMMFMSLLVEQIGNMLGDNYILLDYNELEQKSEDNESSTNDLSNLKENLDKVPKYMNLIKTSLLLNFKAVDDSYQNTLVNYDKNGNYYYFAFTPDLFKDFCKKYVSSLEGNYYTQFPILYKQIMGEDFVVTDEMTMEVREYCDKLNKSIEEFDYNFEKMIVAFFFSNNSLKVVTETTIDVDNSSVSTMIVKNSPDLIFNSPSNAKSFEETIESLSEIFSSGLMGGFENENNEEDNNFAEGLSQCFLKNGTSKMEGNLNVGNFKVMNIAEGTLPNDAVNRSQLDNVGLIIKEFMNSLVKVGDIKASVISQNHDNWILCNGQELSRSDYADLFDIIGDLYEMF